MSITRDPVPPFEGKHRFTQVIRGPLGFLVARCRFCHVLHTDCDDIYEPCPGPRKVQP